MDPITAGFLIAAGLWSVVVGALCYTPADFDHLTVDRGVIVTDALGGVK